MLIIPFLSYTYDMTNSSKDPNIIDKLLDAKIQRDKYERSFIKAHESKNPANWYVRRKKMMNELFKNPLLMELKAMINPRSKDYSKDRITIVNNICDNLKIPKNLSLYINIRLFDNEEDDSLITPPVSYISFKNNLLGPDIYPAEKYKRYKDSGLLRFGSNDNRLLLAIEDGTTKEELITFIEDFYSDHLKPNLKSDKVRKKPEININSERDAAILNLYLEGYLRADIAKKFNISVTNVTKTLKRNGVQINA
jgi:hypothetical protein